MGTGQLIEAMKEGDVERVGELIRAGRESRVTGEETRITGRTPQGKVDHGCRK
jgi:hypothetical protein